MLLVSSEFYMCWLAFRWSEGSSSSCDEAFCFVIYSLRFWTINFFFKRDAVIYICNLPTMFSHVVLDEQPAVFNYKNSNIIWMTFSLLRFMESMWGMLVHHYLQITFVFFSEYFLKPFMILFQNWICKRHVQLFLLKL